MPTRKNGIASGERLIKGTRKKTGKRSEFAHNCNFRGLKLRQYFLMGKTMAKTVFLSYFFNGTKTWTYETGKNPVLPLMLPSYQFSSICEIKSTV